MDLSKVYQQFSAQLLETTDGELWSLKHRLASSGLASRVLRGQKMHTVGEMFDEFAAVLQFEFYFGHNWPAFDECLSEMDYFPFGKGIVLLISRANELLVAEPESMTWFAGSLENASDVYAQPIERGEWWDRPAIPFHVVFHTLPGAGGQVIKTWTEAGLRILPFSTD